MATVNKVDFYYGAMLSVMITKGVQKPALFEESENKRIYTFCTNKGDYQMYMKYASAPSKRKNVNKQLWQFTFTPDEIKVIDSTQDNGKKTLFGLICAKVKLNESELVILNLDQAKLCLGLDVSRDTYRITVKYEKGNHGLKVYGSGLSDRLEDVDNTLLISRDILNSI
ncbi:MAG: hypothetical protein ACOH15_11450 [Acetobacterium sp.]